MNRNPSDTLLSQSSTSANPALQASTPTHPPRWRTLSARDRPLREDAWIASVLNDPDMRSRWTAFIEAPRFVYSEDTVPWSVVVLAKLPYQADDDLLARLFAMSSAQQTPAWAVCRYTQRIYRLPLLAMSPGLLELNPTESDNDAQNAFATVAEWADATTRQQWQARLADERAFELSQCLRPFRRAQEPGEFASLRDGDRNWDPAQWLTDVTAIDARSALERRQLWSRLHRRERALARMAMRLIEQHLDPAIRNAACAAGLLDGLSAQRVNWLSEVPAGSARSRRLQALVAAPLLLPLLLRTAADAATGDGPLMVTLNEDIEQGKALFPLLAQRIGLTERTVRHLRTALLRVHHLNRAYELRTVARRMGLLSWLDLIPVDQWPRNVAQWTRWVRLTVSLSDQAARIVHVLGTDEGWADPVAPADVDVDTGGFDANAVHAGIAHAFYRDVAARRWKLNLGVRHAVEWEHEDALVLHRMGIELRDFLGALDGGDDDEPGEPETQHEPHRIDTLAQGLPASVRRALRRWSITDWWAASDRWHQCLIDAGEHHGASVSRYANVDELMHWPALLSPFTFRTPTAVRRIEFLTNSTLLVEEGTAMNHCVSVRVDDCLTERLHIASVRDGDGRRCSTLALRLDCVGGQWCAVQVEHLTAHNRRPDVACVQAVEQLMAKLKQPVWQQRFTENEAARVERETALRARLPERRQRTNSLRHAALKAALPEHLFLQLNLHEG